MHVDVARWHAVYWGQLENTLATSHPELIVALTQVGLDIPRTIAPASPLPTSPMWSRHAEQYGASAHRSRKKSQLGCVLTMQRPTKKSITPASKLSVSVPRHCLDAATPSPANSFSQHDVHVTDRLQSNLDQEHDGNPGHQCARRWAITLLMFTHEDELSILAECEWFVYNSRRHPLQVLLMKHSYSSIWHFDPKGTPLYVLSGFRI